MSDFTNTVWAFWIVMIALFFVTYIGSRFVMLFLETFDFYDASRTVDDFVVNKFGMIVALSTMIPMYTLVIGGITMIVFSSIIGAEVPEYTFLNAILYGLPWLILKTLVDYNKSKVRSRNIRSIAAQKARDKFSATHSWDEV